MRNNCHGADYGMISHMDSPEYFSTGSDIHVTTDCRKTTMTEAKRNLLKNKTVRSDRRVGMDDYAIWVGHHQAACDAAVYRHIGSGDD